MEEFRRVVQEAATEQLYQMILSNPVDRQGFLKAKVRPVLVKDELMFQISRFTETKVYHENLTATQLVQVMEDEMRTHFKQLEVETQSMRATVLISKKGKVTVNKKNMPCQSKTDTVSNTIDLSHNRAKKYILEEGQKVDFLVDLGVQTQDGKIVKAKYDKFRQINRYLEFIQDILPSLPKDRTLTIIDFGCGKSYLTFAMYYYLKMLKEYDIRVIGLDLKEDVIDHCNRLRDKYGFSSLNFLKGDISTFEGVEAVDMVVTLHACDTATDYALYKAMKWNARVILSVPCCQHEVNKQIKNMEMQTILKYGLLRERMSALITDGLRANLLEEYGYETQVLEFIDMEHTPKNILLRAVKKNPGMTFTEAVAEQQAGKPKTGSLELTEFLHIQPTLQRLLSEETK